MVTKDRKANRMIAVALWAALGLIVVFDHDYRSAR